MIARFVQLVSIAFVVAACSGCGSAGGATPAGVDTDADGMVDTVDTEDNNDGVDDVDDDSPTDPSETTDTDGDGTGDNADLDDDGDGCTDAAELSAGTDPLSPTDTPRDVDDDGTCDPDDACPLRSDDACASTSDYRDCFDLVVDGRVAPLANGAYWVDADGPGPAPSRQVYCEMTIEGGGFALFVHQDDSPVWADWNHNFDLDAQSGTYAPTPVASGNFYLAYRNFVEDPLSPKFATDTEFLFATGDWLEWIVAPSSSLRLNGELAFSDAPQVVRSDSLGNRDTTYNWYFRDLAPEDPWVSLGDHHANDVVMLYGEGNSVLHADKGKQRAGANVLVRRADPRTGDYDGDGYDNAHEVECGTAGFDATSVPADADGDCICDALDARPNDIDYGANPKYIKPPNPAQGGYAFAITKCEDVYGTRLAAIHSAEENEQARSACLENNPNDVCWIGLSDQVTEGTFLWEDATPLDYTNWAPGQPDDWNNADCVQILPSGEWDDANCGANKRIVCSLPPPCL